jgi:hypothetical protein
VGKAFRTVMGAKRAQEREAEKARFLEEIREGARQEFMQSLRKASMKEKARFVFELLRAK